MLTRVSNTLVRWFPVLSLSVGILALLEPKCFLWFGSESISIGLGLIMLGMGMTLEAVDFVRVFRNPKIIALGLAAQYGIMPVAGWGISILFDLPKEIALGLIMVSCCPGGELPPMWWFIWQRVVLLCLSPWPLFQLSSPSSWLQASFYFLLVNMSPLIHGFCLEALSLSYYFH